MIYHVITLPFDFQVKLYKPKDYSTETHYVIFNYDENDLIIQQDYIIEQTDPSVIRKLFDAGFKYLNTPEMLCEMIYKQIMTLLENQGVKVIEAEGKEFVDGEKEESKFYKMLKDTVTDEWLAPLSSPYTGGTDIFKYKNTNENRVYLYK